ncbi:MAG: hypothetical protein ABMA26_10610 [Limisphaerales bacterium]
MSNNTSTIASAMKGYAKLKSHFERAPIQQKAAKTALVRPKKLPDETQRATGTPAAL